MIKPKLKYAGILLALLLSLKAISQQKPYKVLKKHSDHVMSVKFSPDGNRFITGSADHYFYIWDFATMEIVKEKKGHFHDIYVTEYSHDGSTIITAGDRVIKLWTKEGEFIKTLQGHKTSVWSISPYTKQNIIVSGSFDKSIIEWNTQSGKVEFKSEPIEKSMLAVAISPDGKFIAGGSQDNMIRIWDKESDTIVAKLYAHAGNIYDLKFSPDGKYLASASMDKIIKIWNTSDWKIHRLLDGHERAVMKIDFSSNGVFLASCSYDATVKLWDLKSGENITTYINQEMPVNAVDISSDDKYILSGTSSNTIEIWEILPETLIEFYFEDEFNKEYGESEFAKEKQPGESRTDYKLRMEKAKAFKQELLKKYLKKLKN